MKKENYEKLKRVIQKAVPEIMAKKERKRMYDKEYKLENKDKISLQGKRYYQKYKDKINAKHRIYANSGGNLKRYGITLNEYNEMLKIQNNVCAICNKVEIVKLNGKIKKLAVDHCHKTNKNRGLLCDSCNRGLGYFRDSQMIMKNALNYLKKYEN